MNSEVGTLPLRIVELKERIVELKDHINHLKNLLDDPQPGLMSWCISYCDEMQWISKWWDQGKLRYERTHHD